jgi:hypothetical protein
VREVDWSESLILRGVVLLLLGGVVGDCGTLLPSYPGEKPGTKRGVLEGYKIATSYSTELVEYF